MNVSWQLVAPAGSVVEEAARVWKVSKSSLSQQISNKKKNWTNKKLALKLHLLNAITFKRFSLFSVETFFKTMNKKSTLRLKLMDKFLVKGQIFAGRWAKPKIKRPPITRTNCTNLYLRERKKCDHIKRI